MPGGFMVSMVHTPALLAATRSLIQPETSLSSQPTDFAVNLICAGNVPAAIAA
jgi:hypothetical protein